MAASGTSRHFVRVALRAEELEHREHGQQAARQSHSITGARSAVPDFNADPPADRQRFFFFAAAAPFWAAVGDAGLAAASVSNLPNAMI